MYILMVLRWLTQIAIKYDLVTQGTYKVFYSTNKIVIKAIHINNNVAFN